MTQVAHIAGYALVDPLGRWAAHIAGYGQKEVSVLEEEVLDLVDRSAEPDSEY